MLRQVLGKNLLHHGICNLRGLHQQTRATLSGCRIASQMRFRFEFDPVNKILLARFEGRLTDESLAEATRVGRKHWAATDARAGIADYSAVTEFAVSAEFVRTLTRQEPPMPDVTKNPLAPPVGESPLYNFNRSEDGANITTKTGGRHAFRGRGGGHQG